MTRRTTNRRPCSRRAATLAARSAILVSWVLVACGAGNGEERSPRFVVIGIDGADWRVIEELWEEGRLPHLAALAETGVRAPLGTAYVKSPVIWTTIATGVAPWVHGIRDFVTPTEAGDVPVSSRHRRVPALWNMLSTVGRRVAVLGWWASWPAEEIDGVVVTDRVLQDLEGRVWPPELAADLPAAIEAARRRPSRWGSEGPELRDRLMAQYGERLAADTELDLILVYFRSLDVTSHLYWKYHEPERFAGVTDAEVEAEGGRVAAAYDAVDEAIGRIVAAAGEGTNVLVLSDHGFKASKREEVRVFLDLDGVLERLGYLQRLPGGGGVDLARSRVFTYGSREGEQSKRVRFSRSGRDEGGTVLAAPEAELRRSLENDLAAVTYTSGRPVFRVRDAHRREERQGANVVVEVLSEGATPELQVRGATLAGVVSQISRISGTHTKSTRGIFVAAGPDIDPGADLGGIRVHDITPTLLYGLGLPVAEDFAGTARSDLFRGDRVRPVATVTSWDSRESPATGAAERPAEAPAEADAEVLRQLRALGYIP